MLNSRYLAGRGQVHRNFTMCRISGNGTNPLRRTILHYDGVGIPILISGEFNPTDATSAILVGDCHANKQFIHFSLTVMFYFPGLFSSALRLFMTAKQKR